MFRCDLGEEYSSNKFYELLTLDGTIHRTLFKILLSKMALLKENIGHVVETNCFSCCLLLFLVCFGVKLFLLL